MLSQPCHVAAATGVAMTLEGKIEVHSKCPGLCVYIDQTVECECICHTDQGSKLRKAVAAKRSEAPLPVAMPVSAPEPAPARQDRPRPSRAAGGRCECGCGRTTGGRFAPGHDAQLKSKLWKSAMAGGYKDYAEMKLRGWLKGKDLSKLPFETDSRGDEFAALHPDLVELRTAARWKNAPSGS
jgi:hypothetical protein